jgi:P27 family predicted phage terminase small subunit
MTLKLVKPATGSNDPPRKLGAHGTQLWNSVIAEYGIEDCAGVEMLLLACQALDRAERCCEQIDKHGEMIVLRNGSVRDNPLMKIELANRAFLVRTLSRLGLDAEPIKAIGRPASALGWRGPHAD